MCVKWRDYVQMVRDKCIENVHAKARLPKIAKVKNQIKCVAVVVMEKRLMQNVLIINSQNLQLT